MTSKELEKFINKITASNEWASITGCHNITVEIETREDDSYDDDEL